jgi:hypothetical protein
MAQRHCMWVIDRVLLSSISKPLTRIDPPSFHETIHRIPRNWPAWSAQPVAWPVQTGGCLHLCVEQTLSIQSLFRVLSFEWPCNESLFCDAGSHTGCFRYALWKTDSLAFILPANIVLSGPAISSAIELEPFPGNHGFALVIVGVLGVQDWKRIISYYIVLCFITCHDLCLLWKVDRRVLLFGELWCYLLPMKMSLESFLDPFKNLESEQGKSIFLAVRRWSGEKIAFWNFAARR